MRTRWVEPLPLLLAIILLQSLLFAQQPQERGFTLPATSTDGEAAAGPTSSQEFGVYHALIIGIDDYRYWPHLEFAEKDADEIQEILISKYTFDSNNVVRVSGSEATESKILGELTGFIRRLGPNDNLLIYYAGHGQLDPLTETGYWVPVDGASHDDSTWIPFSTIRVMLEAPNVKAKNILVVTDSCYGGALTRGEGPTAGKPRPSQTGYEESLRKLASHRSRQVIASGGFTKVPDRSHFAELLKQALSENERRMVDFEQLFYDKVFPKLTEEGVQRPNMARIGNAPGESGQFVLLTKASAGLLPRVELRPAPPPTVQTKSDIRRPEPGLPHTIPPAGQNPDVMAFEIGFKMFLLQVLSDAPYQEAMRQFARDNQLQAHATETGAALQQFYKNQVAPQSVEFYNVGYYLAQGQIAAAGVIAFTSKNQPEEAANLANSYRIKVKPLIQLYLSRARLEITADEIPDSIAQEPGSLDPNISFGLFVERVRSAVGSQRR